MKALRTSLIAGLAVVAVASASWAEPVQFPLTVDYEVLRAAVRKHLQDEVRDEPKVWRTADGCGSFVLREASVEPSGGRLKIAGPASGTAAFSLFGFCWGNLSWTGRAEILARPEIGGDWQLRLRDLDAELYDSSGRKQSIAARLFSVAKGWVEAELSTFTVDLNPPVAELGTLLGSFAGSAGATPLTAALGTMRPAAVAVESDAVRVVVALELPPAAPVPPSPESALTPAQIRRWEARLDSWDGFLSFVVKNLAGENADPTTRDELLGILLDTRREVVAVLGRGPQPGTDAVRQIFLATWDRLRVIVRQTVIEQKGDPARAFRYVVFLAAGDALTAIDAAAPALGLDFSADGLRRLAKSLDPAFTGDPLDQSEVADPHLQQLFHFRDPDAPPRRPRRKPPGSSWHWFEPGVAYAAETDEWRGLAVRLDRWVPEADELPAYRETVDRLLTVAAERSLDPDALDERFDDLYYHVVKTTAWQESCWRQFVRQGGVITYLASRTGDVGLMQINVRIWRGFFDGTKLRWNAAYNAGAGAEILQQLLIRYGTREARARLENAARATYSAYHGGPARYRRYRTAATASRGWAIDHSFWEKYQAVAAGTAGDRVLCLRHRTTS